MAGPEFKVEVEGVDKLLRDLKGGFLELFRATVGALVVEGESLISEAKIITPVDEGTLRSSGHVQEPKIEGETITVEMGFGGPAGTGNIGGQTNEPAVKNTTGDVGYAVYVHEDLEAFHNVGEAKYLETPLKRRKVGFAARLSARIKRRTGA